MRATVAFEIQDSRCSAGRAQRPDAPGPLGNPPPRGPVSWERILARLRTAFQMDAYSLDPIARPGWIIQSRYVVELCLKTTLL